MCDNERYNGWSNRETWAARLWIDNDQGLQEQFLGLAKGEPDLYKLTEVVKEQLETLLTPSFYRDEFGANQPIEVEMMASEVGSLWRVNYTELAASLLDSVREGC